MEGSNLLKPIGFGVILAPFSTLQVFADPTLPPSQVTIDVSSLVGKDISLDFSTSRFKGRG